MKKWLITAAGLLVGAAAGYGYFHYFGCTNGCPLKSNGTFMAIYGAVLGLFTVQTVGEIAGKIRRARQLKAASGETEAR